MRTLRALLAIGLPVSFAASCGGGASSLARPPEFAPKDQTKCGVAKSQSRPLIVEWPSADRQQLETKIRQGVVAVRYVGCEMDVLPRCAVPGRYAYLASTRKEDRVDVKDDDDLYANLPVGAARLEGKLQKSGRLTIEMQLVGRYEADRSTIKAEELTGDCAGATHFVYGVSVGAFDFYAGARAQVGGGVGVGGVGAGAASEAERESLTKDGDVAACARATSGDKAPPESCGAIIRIEVVPIERPKVDAAQASAPGGMARVPAADVMLGDPGGDKWENKVRNAHVDAFEIDRTEVTVAEYAKCVASGACTAADQGDFRGLKDDCTWGHPDKTSHPINCVDWRDASAYCKWAGKRLPTQEEWEYAARGTDGRRFPWGSSPPDDRVCWKRKSAGTCAAGTSPTDRSPFGVFDMAASVGEWTADGGMRGGTFRIDRDDPNALHVARAAEPGDEQARKLRMPILGFRCAR